jgi:hypothetical protein
VAEAKKLAVTVLASRDAIILDDRSSAEITRLLLPRAEQLVGRIKKEKFNPCLVMSESFLPKLSPGNTRRIGEMSLPRARASD